MNQGMIGTRKNRMAKLRALAAAFALLIGSIAAPIALAGNAPDVCAMACCVEEGHCCCSPRRAFVKGQNSDDSPGLSEAEIFASCPEGCANPTTSSNLLMRVVARSPGVAVSFFRQAPIRYQHIASARIFIDLDSSPLRGPPCRFTPEA
jgi:hypothetical protein